MERKKLIAFGLFSALLFGSFSCSEQSLGIFDKASPWEQYSDKLKKADLNETKAGKRWLAESRQVLLSPPQVDVPFAMAGAFKAKNVNALAWAMELQRGATIQIELDWNPIDSARLFLDFFRGQDDLKHVFSLKAFSGSEELEIEQTGTYILRLQPELLAEGNFELSVTGETTYSVFPVQGKDSYAIHSVFGDPRDGGTRRHEGVDIFADKGTPVVSPVRGMVSSVRTGGLGGKTVWVRDRERGHSLYFAHLDSQAVAFGKAVRPGDTLGFVGNTGNAKYTPPHLHFGVYSGGAFDPYPLVDNIHEDPEEINLSAEADLMSVITSRGNLREGPSTQHEILTTLAGDEVVFVDAVTRDWYQVRTPDHLEGFMHRSLLGAISPSQLGADTAWVHVDPFVTPVDSLRLPLTAFSDLGAYAGYRVLADTNRNVYYRRR